MPVRAHTAVKRKYNVPQTFVYVYRFSGNQWVHVKYSCSSSAPSARVGRAPTLLKLGLFSCFYAFGGVVWVV